MAASYSGTPMKSLSVSQTIRTFSPGFTPMQSLTAIIALSFMLMKRPLCKL